MNKKLSERIKSNRGTSIITVALRKCVQIRLQPTYPKLITTNEKAKTGAPRTERLRLMNHHRKSANAGTSKPNCLCDMASRLTAVANPIFLFVGFRTARDQNAHD